MYVFARIGRGTEQEMCVIKNLKVLFKSQFENMLTAFFAQFYFW